MMKNIDYLALDGRSLYMIKLIHEYRSVTEGGQNAWRDAILCQPFA